MKTIFKFTAVSLAMLAGATSCIQEIDPQGEDNLVSSDQAANAPGAFDNFVSAVTGSLTGNYIYSPSNQYPWDFGMPSLWIQRDIMGQDILPCYITGSEWYQGWYSCSGYLTSDSGWGSYLSWLFYYTWMNNCNTVTRLAGYNSVERNAADIDTDKAKGVATALAIRALCNLEMAQIYATETYTKNPEAITVPIVTESTPSDQLANNPRVPAKDLFALILGDLEDAATLLGGYTPGDKSQIGIDMVTGLKARTYLVMGDYQKAKDCAMTIINKSDYSVQTPEQITSMTSGFNTVNQGWIWYIAQKSSDACLMTNDCDSSWGSQMINECSGHGCGYSGNYVGAKRIDKHLFDCIAETDYRKMQFVDFALDGLSAPEIDIALEAYTGRDASGAISIAYDGWYNKSVGGVPVKFRPKGGNYDDQYSGFCTDIPAMRIEEMILIAAECTVRNGGTLESLPCYVEYINNRYKGGWDAYVASSTAMNINTVDEVWMQRRIELWGEGFSTFDLKRLGKGVIRSYAGTNHAEGYRWNTTDVANWMTLLISGDEANYNEGIVQNPIPQKPTGDSPEHQW